MDCRTFRKSHVVFVDGLMDDGRLGKMYEHMEGCARCARLDTNVRRGLLVARNLPRIKPSPDFMSRLQARLQAPQPLPPVRPRFHQARVALRFGTVAAVTIGGLMVLHAVRGQEAERQAPPAARAAVVGASASEVAVRELRQVPPADSQIAAVLAAGLPAWRGSLIPDRAVTSMVPVEVQTASLAP